MTDVAVKQETQRVVMDNYPTPQPLADAICRWLRELYPYKTVILEPSCGSGNFLRAAQQYWSHASQILGIDLDPSHEEEVLKLGYQFVHADFLQYATLLGQSGWLGPQTIVPGNPPYSDDLPQKFIQAVYDHSQEGCVTAFLLRQSFEAGIDRAVNFPARESLAYKRVVAGRPKFRTDTKSQDNSEYAVYVYEKGHTGHYVGWKDPLIWKPKHLLKYGWR